MPLPKDKQDLLDSIDVECGDKAAMIAALMIYDLFASRMLVALDISTISALAINATRYYEEWERTNET